MPRPRIHHQILLRFQTLSPSNRNSGITSIARRRIRSPRAVHPIGGRGSVAPSMRTAPIPLILAAVLAATPALPLPSRPPRPPGGCHNVYVDSPCTFTSLMRVHGDQGTPVAPDAPVDPDGTVTFSAGYALADSASASPAVWVRATPGDRPALERYFSMHRQAHCRGVIIRAPCPPGVHVVVDVPPPPVGTVLRGLRRHLEPDIF